MPKPKRDLIPKRPLLPPKNPPSLSTTQPPASKEEVSVKLQKSKSILVHEYNFQATPQPFLDPALVQRRMAVEREWQLEREKEAKQQALAAASSTR